VRQSYHEGAANPGDAAIVGDEASVAEQIQHLEKIGVTDFGAAPTGSSDEVKRTMALLRNIVSAR